MSMRNCYLHFVSLERISWPIHPLQNGLDTKVEKSRKQMKERKNRAKKIRGVKKVRETLVNVGQPSLSLSPYTSAFSGFVKCADQGWRCCQGWEEEMRCCRFRCLLHSVEAKECSLCGSSILHIFLQLYLEYFVPFYFLSCFLSSSFELSACPNFCQTI